MLKLRAIVPAVLVVGCIFWSVKAAEMRTWTASEGGYQARGEMLELTADNVVVLRREDGKELRIPINLLSGADRQYALSRIDLKKGAVPAVAVPTATISTAPVATVADPGTSTTRTGAATQYVTAARVESEAQNCKTAKMALLVYQSYLNGDQLDSVERPLVEKKLPDWKGLADRNFVRLGKQWLAKSEADKLRTEADDMVTHAIELLRLKSDEAAKQILEKATRLDPESPKAEFLMGFVYGIVARNDDRAVFHFDNALRREPGNVSALNNIAVSEFFLKRYAQAVAHWEEAAARSPQNKRIVDNLATVLEIQGLRITKLPRLPPHLLDRLSETYRTMLNQKDMKPPKKDDKLHFWYISPYGREWAIVDGSSDKTNPDSGEDVIAGGGSGFVVADHYVVTNHHVIHGAESMLVMNPSSKEEDPLPATVVASSAELDLAVLYCEKLTAPPVPLATELPRRGSDVMVLGYPEMFRLGYHLKTTRGSVTGLPTEATDNLLLIDAIANPGNSGGPICDDRGAIVAVLSSAFLFQNNYTAGVPMTAALPFMKQHIPNFQPVPPPPASLPWPDVDAKISPSTVLLLRKQRAVTDAGFGDRGKSRGVEDDDKKYDD